MSAARHPEVKAPAAEPCPFCGCGSPLAAHAPAVRRSSTRSRAGASYTTSTGRVVALTAKEAAYHAWRERTPRGDDIASWAYPEPGTREHTAAEIAAIAAYASYFAAHRGEVAIIDERTNTVTGWEPATHPAITRAA